MVHFGRIESLSQTSLFTNIWCFGTTLSLQSVGGIFLSIIYLSKCVGIHCLLDVLINEIFDSENVCFFCCLKWKLVLTHKWIQIFQLKYLHDVNKLQRKEFFFKYTPKSVKLLLEISATKSNRLNTNIDTCQATIVHANALIFFYYLQNRFTSISRLETEEHVANVITKNSNKSKFLPKTAQNM